MHQRRRKNVVTLVGQFLSFIIEIIGALIIMLVVVYHGNNEFIGIVPPLKLFGSALMTITFFVSSPELRKFYHLIN